MKKMMAAWRSMKDVESFVLLEAENLSRMRTNFDCLDFDFLAVFYRILDGPKKLEAQQHEVCETDENSSHLLDDPYGFVFV